MWYVYILKSKKQDWRYIGSTGDLRERFKSHNRGKNQATRHYLPFKLGAYVAVSTELKARKLEKYFKTGSGSTILKKRILQSTKL
jgi:putative endonuclease